MRIDSTGRVLIGAAAARTNLFDGLQTASSQIEGTNLVTSTQSIIRNSANTGQPAVFLGKTRGATTGSNTIVAQNDGLGTVNFGGADGTNIITAASVAAQSDGIPALNDMPGRLVFSTTASGAAAATERMRIDSAGTTTFTSAATTAPAIFKISTTEVARIDSSGRLLVGTSSSVSAANIAAGVQLSALATGSGASLSVVRYANDASGGEIIFGKSRSGVNATPGTIVQNGDFLGILRWAGDNGTDLSSSAATIFAAVDGEPGTAGDLTDLPGRLVFATSADGASSPTERMRIDSAGTTTFTSAATTAPAIFKINTTEVGRFDSAGRLLVNTSTGRGVASATQAEIQVETSNALGISIVRNSADGVAGILSLAKSRGTTSGAVTAVVEGDILGEIRFAGADGTDLASNGAAIRALVDGGVGTSDMPSRIVMATSPDGSAGTLERLRITNDGIVAYNQPAEAAVNATATLTIANLKTGIITSTSAAATDMTLPTGTLTEAGFSGVYTNMTFEWSVINTGPSLVRVLAGASHTITGSGSVAAGTSGRFATRRTAANTFVTYRLS
jgi:hypothetical protein